ncbi:MAG: DUF2723 domain-containing protein [Bacteroidia bacterium]
MQYKLINNIGGWVSFLVAFIAYYLTMAPTASFWDCGEFIACANELEVPHPPGAPFFLILGRFFAMFASSPETVAWWVNMVSVLASAFCVMFTFWITSYLAKKLITSNTNRELDFTEIMVIMASGMVGALTCAFADSFWFNAVEAEVYALSSFFTAAVVWLIFKWEERADEPDHLKWIVLIAFVMGMSIGTHLLNLLAIPMLAFVYYFRKFKISPLGIVVTFVTSIVILALVQYGVIQWSAEIAWSFERFFVGSERMDAEAGLYEKTGMGMGFGTGIIVFMVFAIGALIAGLVLTQNNRFGSRIFGANTSLRSVVNTACWSILVIVVGYSSYTMIVIRAGAGTPINENDPSSIASMISYLKREQYGDSPLLRGVRYNDAVSGRNQEVKYEREAYVNPKEPRFLAGGSYELDGGGALNVKDGKAVGYTAPAPNNGDKFETKLKDGRKIAIDTKTLDVTRIEDRYLWSGFKQDVDYRSGKVWFPRMHSPQGGHYTGEYGYKNYVKKKGASDSPADDSPSFSDDMKFFFDYQVRHMYLRYFMWNFAGRESDVQDWGWESGFEFGRFKGQPSEMLNHAGKNHYFLIPLLLGLFGMVYQFVRNYKDATSILLLFFFTGFAIILYLNQTPAQPRERDYSYAGSFQTFAIWVGLAVVAIYDLLRDLAKLPKTVAAAICFLPLGSPILMAAQNWDDHSRHIQFVAPDSAFNLLNSCKKNGILFTNGDNDTFPLWYLQEVEGIRTDVRVVNLSLLNTDWYIDQMKQQSNESPPLPISSPQSDYIGEEGAFRPWERGKLVEIPVDRKCVLDNGTVLPEYASYLIAPKVKWAIATRGGSQSYLLKQDWLILDIILTNANNCWERPIYFSSTIPPSSYIGLQPFFQVEGLANRVVPVDFTKFPCPTTDPYGRQGRVQKDISYDLLMKTFKYRNLSDTTMYLDDHIRRTIIGNMSSMIFRAANAFTDDMECLESQNKYMRGLKEKEPLKADSLDRVISSNKKKIEEFKTKAAELLTMADDSISDAARGNDAIYPMFAATVWERLDNLEKVKSNFDKVLNKADAWVTYYNKSDTKLPEYDRLMSAVPFVMQKAREMKLFDTAIRAADIAFQDSKDPQFKAMAEQFRQESTKGGGAGAPKEMNPSVPGGDSLQPEPDSVLE